jgi:large subunit ribosomal protein L5
MSDTEQTATVEYSGPRLKQFYNDTVVPQLKERFAITNLHAVPRLQKIVLNMGLGEALNDKGVMPDALAVLTTITGQHPVAIKARRSVAAFHLREGNPIGAKVTLRGALMFEFLDRLISVVLPRVRDFRGISPKGFDGTGNYNLGMREVNVFPELNLDKITHAFGMDIAMVTSAENDQQGLELLKLMGMPFRQK